MFIEIAKLMAYVFIIILISKYVMVKYLRKLVETWNFKAKTVGNIAGIATSIPELLTVCFSATAGLMSARNI